MTANRMQAIPVERIEEIIDDEQLTPEQVKERVIELSKKQHKDAE